MDVDGRGMLRGMDGDGVRDVEGGWMVTGRDHEHQNI